MPACKNPSTQRQKDLCHLIDAVSFKPVSKPKKKKKKANKKKLCKVKMWLKNKVGRRERC